MKFFIELTPGANLMKKFIENQLYLCTTSPRELKWSKLQTGLSKGKIFFAGLVLSPYIRFCAKRFKNIFYFY